MVQIVPGKSGTVSNWWTTNQVHVTYGHQVFLSHPKSGKYTTEFSQIQTIELWSFFLKKRLKSRKVKTPQQQVTDPLGYPKPRYKHLSPMPTCPLQGLLGCVLTPIPLRSTPKHLSTQQMSVICVMLDYYMCGYHWPIIIVNWFPVRDIWEWFICYMCPHPFNIIWDLLPSLALI